MVSTVELNEAIEAFVIYMRVRKRREASTLYTYTKILQHFVATVPVRTVEELTVKHIDMYADILSLKNYAPKTFRCKLNAIRSFIRFLYIKEYTTIKPECIDVPEESSTVEANFLDLEEAQALVSVTRNTRDRALLLFMLSSWVRVSELTNIRLDDIHNRSVLIRRGKGGKPRPVFISEEAERAVNAYIASDRGSKQGYLFPSPDGTKMSRQRIYRIVQVHAERAGLDKKVTPHTLRHTGATGYLDAGGRLEIAQKLLGHSKLETTMIYVHFKDERLHDDYDEVTKSLSYGTIA